MADLFSKLTAGFNNTTGAAQQSPYAGTDDILNRMKQKTEAKPTYKGSLVDAITLKAVNFKYEPEELGEDFSANWGFQKIVGQALPVCNFVGGGENDVSLTIYLLSTTGAVSEKVSPEEVGQLRFDQLANYQRMIPVKVGTNPDGSDKMQFVKNPEPPPKPMTALEAKTQILQTRKAKQSTIMDDLNALRQFTQIQEDIGAPHPVLINFGGIFSGRKFVLKTAKVTYMSYGLSNQVPYEATVKLTLQEVEVAIASQTEKKVPK